MLLEERQITQRGIPLANVPLVFAKLVMIGTEGDNVEAISLTPKIPLWLLASHNSFRIATQGGSEN